ncbi:zinc-binding dehydrogenase [Corynebacterium propinquum]|uniref:Zinc-binding dehydrogenase n=1 Tax=Corynebacterium propinquum TaxID=43769 RepID=A0AAP4BWH3_9CORY|nr:MULTISPECIES: hypothetical protein [Corynebacterium]MCG7232494.1 zinc-binding dehydrogenase [Corynebacterium propinquum]MDK4235875.1 zinc-binding dehydrogenase [Corynebacterium propinquum]MDK4238278.1 zinc-binding dehydrogenase [Corynebacterium propinquum]MDK4291786.1 zinc-binding dehydrogenase [Corynebacterium propinquum]MDK4301208.1 zinc-binding dehydrogenase [Corynebacterium propinquum]
MMLAVLILAFLAFLGLVLFLATGAGVWLALLFGGGGVALLLLLVDVVRKK